MPAQAETKSKNYQKPRRSAEAVVEPVNPTVIGWQGIRFTLPPDWNLVGFSMDRENGYLRVDAPGDASLTVQVRWMSAARPEAGGSPTLYSLAAPYVRRVFQGKSSAPSIQKPDLRGNLERILKETEKQAKKAKTEFDSVIKPEKSEGEDDERDAIHFSWTGVGRGQGKIWHCRACHRVVVAQIVGMAKDQAAISAVASQLFSTIRDHGVDGYDRWALYDLQIDVPEDFRLEEQKLLSGHLHLEWGRGGERIVLDRWGLANMMLKKFSLTDWFRNNAVVSLKSLPKDDAHTVHGHASVRYVGKLPLLGRLYALRNAKGSLRQFPAGYEGGIWNCTDSNKIFAVQTLHQRRNAGLWEDVVSRCACHRPGQTEPDSPESDLES